MKRTVENMPVTLSRRRAIELYARDTPFRQRVVELKTAYRRHPKHRNQEQ